MVANGHFHYTQYCCLLKSLNRISGRQRMAFEVRYLLLWGTMSFIEVRVVETSIESDSTKPCLVLEWYTKEESFFRNTVRWLHPILQSS